TGAFGAISPIEGKAEGSGGSSTRTDASMPWGSPAWAAGGFNTPAHLRMLCEEGCRTAVLGKTERTVGWEGDGDPIMTGLVRHCHGETRSNSSASSTVAEPFLYPRCPFHKFAASYAMQRPVCKAWADKRPVQSVWVVS